jgi:hypothetical protein
MLTGGLHREEQAMSEERSRDSKSTTVGQADRGYESAISGPAAVKAIRGHVEKYVGNITSVLHEPAAAGAPNIDVLVVGPTTERNCYTLVTCGMSEKPMHVPLGVNENPFAELMMCLPPAWVLSEPAVKDEANYWPIRLLNALARLPHERSAWLAPAQIFPHGNPARFYGPNTAMCCALLSWPLMADRGFRKLPMAEKKIVQFLAVVPLYKEEMELKNGKGTNALLDRLDAIRVSELLDVKRKNTCAGKKFLGLF